MLIEHQPNYDRLKDIFLHSPEELLFRHIREPWHDDKADLRELLIATTAMLVAHDTQTDKGTKFSECMDAIRTLFVDLEQSGSVVIFEVPYPNPNQTTMAKAPPEDVSSEVPDPNRMAMIIAPPEDVPAVEKVIRMFEGNNTNEPIEINNTIIHFHIDTFPISPNPKALATTIASFDPTTELLYGNGTSDVKGHASLASMLSRLCQMNEIKSPVFVITSDEEKGGNLGGLQLLRSMKSRKMIIDWEPCDPGTYSDGILPSIPVGLLALSELSYPMLQTLQHLLLNSFTKNDCDPTVSVRDDQVLLNLSTHHLFYPGSPHTPEKLAHALLEIAYNAGIPFNEENCTYWLSDPCSSTISSKKRKLISGALRKHFPCQPSKQTLSHRSSSKGGHFVWWDRQTTYTGDISTLAFCAHPNCYDVIALGADESGSGRHTKNEAVNVNQLDSLLYTTFDIHKGLILNC